MAQSLSGIQSQVARWSELHPPPVATLHGQQRPRFWGPQPLPPGGARWVRECKTGEEVSSPEQCLLALHGALFNRNHLEAV